MAFCDKKNASKSVFFFFFSKYVDVGTVLQNNKIAENLAENLGKIADFVISQSISTLMLLDRLFELDFTRRIF